MNDLLCCFDRTSSTLISITDMRNWVILENWTEYYVWSIQLFMKALVNQCIFVSGRQNQFIAWFITCINFRENIDNINNRKNVSCSSFFVFRKISNHFLIIKSINSIFNLQFCVKHNLLSFYPLNLKISKFQNCEN